MKWAWVVRGGWGVWEVEEVGRGGGERGWVVKNVRVGWGGRGMMGFDVEFDVDVGGGERRVEREERRVRFLAWVVWRARFNFLVSASLRRRWRMDSGVGAVGGRGSVRF